MRPPFEMVVVDNGSTDATPAVARKHGALYAFVAEPNRGKARNAGIARASGDVIVVRRRRRRDAAALSRGARARARRGDLPAGGLRPDRQRPRRRRTGPEPTPANFSRAFFVTCNVSVRARAAARGRRLRRIVRPVRLGRHRARRAAARARRAARVSRGTRTSGTSSRRRRSRSRTRSARRSRRRAWRRSSCARCRRRASSSRPARTRSTSLRARVLAPALAQPLFAGLATSPRVPPRSRSVARGMLLDSVYTEELDRQLSAAMRPDARAAGAAGRRRRRRRLRAADRRAARGRARGRRRAVDAQRGPLRAAALVAEHVLERIPWPAHGSTPESTARAQRGDRGACATTPR